jgi:hypothetical protein
MKKRLKKSDDEKIHTLGIESRFGEFICKYPWYSMIFLLFIFGVLILVLDKGGEKSILAIKIIVPIFIGTTAFMRFFHRNLCYKLIIDDNDKIIQLYLMFNQGVYETELSNIKVIIDRNINCVVNGRKFKIINHLLHDFIALLPEETEIEFVGFFGRQLEKELIKTDRELKKNRNTEKKEHISKRG